MIGVLLWKYAQSGKQQKRIALRESSRLHMRYMQVEILRSERTPAFLLQRRIQSAVRRLRKLGVNRIVLPENWNGMELPEGVQVMSTIALRQTLAADWVRQALAERGLSTAGAKVAVTAARLTGEVVRTVTELALRQRYVLVDVPFGGQELCQRLRREYGVTLLLEPELAQLNDAEVLVLFDDRRDLKRENPVVLPLYDPSAALPTLVLPPAMEEKLPMGADRPQLLAALLQAGAIQRGDLSLSILPEGNAAAR